MNADGVIGQIGNVQGTNMFVYCFNNPVNMSDPTGNWPQWMKNAANKVKETVKNVVNAVKTTVSKAVDKVKTFVSNAKSDIKNYDKDNTSEQKVIEAHHISAYKGAVVIKSNAMTKNAFSAGVLVIGNGVDDTADIQHEYGHYLQLQEIGIPKYIQFVVAPSLKGYWGDADNYYSQPWEYGADLYGGVDPSVREYTPNAEEEYKIYWDKVTK